MTTTIGALNVPLSMNTAAFTAGTQKARQELSSLAANSNRFLAVVDKSVTNTTVSITKMSKELFSLRNILGAAGIGIGAAAITSFARSVISSTAALVDQAKQAGVTVEALQAYRAVLTDNGGSAEVMDRILTRLTDQIGEAQAGSKEAREKFLALGISVDTVSSSFATAQTILPLVAQNVSKMGSATEQLAALNNLLGDKLGKYVIPAMGELSRSAADLITKEKELGRVTSQDVANQMNKALTEMGQNWNQLETNAAPALNLMLYGLKSIFYWANQGANALSRLPGYFSQGANMSMVTTNPLDSKAMRTPGAADSTSPLPWTLPTANLDLPAGTITKSPLAGYKKAASDASASTQQLRGEYYGETLDLKAVTKDFIDGVKDRASADNEAWLKQLEYARNYRSEVLQGIDEATAHAKEQNAEIITHYQRMSDEMKERQAEMNRYIAMSAADNIMALGEAAIQGSKSFLHAMGSMIIGVMQLIVKLQIAKAIEASLGSGGGGGIFSFLGGGGGILSAFTGLFADGGTIPAGKWGIAGERGPEIISGPANVTPMTNTQPSKVHVVISLTEDLNAKIVRTSGNVVAQFSRSVLPARVMEIANDSRAR